MAVDRVPSQPPSLIQGIPRGKFAQTQRGGCSPDRTQLYNFPVTGKYTGNIRTFIDNTCPPLAPKPRNYWRFSPTSVSRCIFNRELSGMWRSQNGAPPPSTQCDRISAMTKAHDIYYLPGRQSAINQGLGLELLDRSHDLAGRKMSGTFA